MTVIRCDRCDVVIDDDNQRQLSLVCGEGPKEGDMETLADDLCVRCVNQLREWLERAPVAASYQENQP